MDFISLTNTNSTGPDSYQQSVTTGLVVSTALLLSFVAFLSYTPKVDNRSPPFISDKIVFAGSLGFTTRQWMFWKNAVTKSKTGHFSFWLGKRHVVGLTGEAARKLFLDNHSLDFSSGAALRPLGPSFVPPVPEIFRDGFHKGRSYFLRRLIDLQKTEQLYKYLGRTMKDAREGFEALAKNPSGVTNPSDACWHIVFKSDCRFMFADEVSDDPKLLKSFLDWMEILQSTSSLYNIPFPWLPSIAYVKRRYGRWVLESLVTAIVDKRMKKGAMRRDDPLQTLIDNGDRRDYMIEFFISILFIGPANSRILTGHMLNNMAVYPEWQEKIYGEIKAAAAAHSKDKNATLVEQLDSLPLDVWENSFPSIELCYKEAIRMWTAFAMLRLNISSKAILIPGTNQVIPPGSFASYNSTEVHFNEELYPNPHTFDPERFREGREEFKKENYGFLGWGLGRHPCPGTRWAKLQQNIILVYALAMYKWTKCDVNGQSGTEGAYKKDLDDAHPTVLPQVYCKYVPRNY